LQYIFLVCNNGINTWNAVIVRFEIPRSIWKIILGIIQMSQNIGAKYREGFLAPKKDYPGQSWERTFLVGPNVIDIPHALTEDPKSRRDKWERTLEGEKPQTDPGERAAARLARALIQSGLTQEEYLLASPGLFRYALDKNRELDPAAIGRIFWEISGTASKMGFWPDEVLSGKLNSQERVALFGQVYGAVKGHQRIVNNKDPQLADMSGFPCLLSFTHI
jgi:hypothetical protein